MPHDDDERRAAMVERHVAARGITSPRLLEALRRVPRERFVDRDLAERAFEDAPLPIGEQQTISQPYVVAVMIDALDLEGHERVLEVGTGSGYAAAILAELAAEVHTIERHATLADAARARLTALGHTDVHVHVGDGTRGWPAAAPYDAIVVAAGGPAVPRSLCDQLAVGGRLVIPVGARDTQRLVRITRRDAERLERDDLGGVMFVPLVGEEGWDVG